MPEVVWRDLGRVAYEDALGIQRELARDKKGGAVREDVLLLVEHPAVVTYGRSTSAANVLAPDDVLGEAGVSTVEVERGGDVTFHGPGQLVGYPVIDLTRFRQDLHWYLRSLEEVLIRTLEAFDLCAARAGGLTGVWVGSAVSEEAPEPDRSIPDHRARELMRDGAIRKIASIGVHASRWVTTHGFALNHTADSLAGFELIVPCGLEGVTVTSIETEGRSVSAADLKREIVDSFGRVFGVTMRADRTEPADAPAG